MNIYEISAQGIWTGRSHQVGEKDPIPRGWTRTAPPDLAPGEYAQWSGGRFVVTSELPPEPPATAADVKAEWERRVDIGGAFAVLGVADPIPVPGRQPYREIIQAKLSAAQLFKAQGITDPIMRFRDGANVEHMLTPDQMLMLCLQSMQFYEALSVVYHDMKDGKGDFTGGIPADFTEDGYWS